jgi:hypothetical protein
VLFCKHATVRGSGSRVEYHFYVLMRLISHNNISTIVEITSDLARQSAGVVPGTCDGLMCYGNGLVGCLSLLYVLSIQPENVVIGCVMITSYLALYLSYI